MIRYLLMLSLFWGWMPVQGFAWGFYAHAQINGLAVYLLPPEMLLFFKPNRDYLMLHATDPDKRRYLVAAEGPRHYIDIDHYGSFPYPDLPRRWTDAVNKFSEDTLNAHGIVPWHIQRMIFRLTRAFETKDARSILRLSAELGHYIADAHVPLHTSSNHNGQKTNQHGIHGFWESRVPELLAEESFDFFIGKADYLPDPTGFIWNRVLESAAAVDSVLRCERELSARFREDEKFAFENRNNKLVKQYSTAFTRAYNAALNHMVERRFRASVYSIASCWYTAWVNAGQPDLQSLVSESLSADEQQTMEALNKAWTEGKMIGREE